MVDPKSRLFGDSSAPEEPRDSMRRTDVFYEEQAETYFQRTVSVDLSHLYGRFLRFVHPGGRILDVGCGSGRDLRAFRMMGFRPVGIDSSKALVELARSFSGVDCVTGRIEEMSFNQQFEGVWACASLLHLPRVAIDEALARIHRALVPGGAFFASVQEGIGERVTGDERFYTLYQEPEFLARIGGARFEILESWISQDILEQQRPIRWLNVISKSRRGLG